MSAVRAALAYPGATRYAGSLHLRYTSPATAPTARSPRRAANMQRRMHTGTASSSEAHAAKPPPFSAKPNSSSAPAGSRVATRRISYTDYPHVLPARTEVDDMLEFSDPMMRHEKYNSGMRIVSRQERLNEEEVTNQQRRVLEGRLRKQLMGKIRAEEIVTSIKMNLEPEMERLKEGILMSDEIPTSVETVTITHIGTLDGFDEPIHPQVTLSRRKALDYEKELSMTLCVEDMSEACDAAICRMRHINAYLARTARAKVALQTAQRQQNADRVQDIVHFPIRSGIYDGDLQIKCREICSELYKGNRVRITARNCVYAQDSAELLRFIALAVEESSYGATGSKPFVTFKMGAPMFSKLTASCILLPLGEGGQTEIVDSVTMSQMAAAVQRADEEEFELECQAVPSEKRAIMEEVRRRKFYGVQEDFLSRKLRDVDMIAKHMPWEMPVTNSDIKQMEHDAVMNESGAKREKAEGYQGELPYGEHVYENPTAFVNRTQGDPSSMDMDLSPGPDNQSRSFVHPASPF